MRVPDPQQWATGLVATGIVNIQGASKTAFVALSAAPSAGATSLSCAQAPTGWAAGDIVLISDSRQVTDTTNDVNYTPQDEIATIASVSGTTVNLTAGLAFAHPGVADPNNLPKFFPQIHNLTRNIVIQSTNPSGTRGHVAFTNKTNVSIQNARFDNLGRTLAAPTLVNNTTISGGKVTTIGTNQDGRHSCNFRHVIGPNPVLGNYQFSVVGSCVTNGNKWGLVLNDSHYGCLKNNVIYKVAGAGLVAAAGNETSNTIVSNCTVRTFGYGGNGNENLGSGDVGSEGSGIWLRGPNNYVCNNFASECSVNGYMLFPTQSGVLNFPTFQGADPTKAGQFISQDLQSTPILLFANNTAYGAIPQGLAVWNLGVNGDHQLLTINPSVILNTTIWHMGHYGIYGWGTANLICDGTTVFTDASITVASANNLTIGLYFADHMTQNVTVLGGTIQGAQVGINCPHRTGDTTNYSGGGTPTVGPFYCDNVSLRCYYNVQVETPWSASASATILPRQVIIHNCSFAKVTNSPRGGDPELNIWMNYRTDFTNPCVSLLDQTFVGYYNETYISNFQVFYNQQTPTFITPQSGGGLIGSPTAGLTNQQNWDSYQLCVGRAFAPPNAFTPYDGLIGGLVRQLTSPGLYFNFTTGIITTVLQGFNNTVGISTFQAGPHALVSVSVTSTDALNNTILSSTGQWPQYQVTSLVVAASVGRALSFNNNSPIDSIAYGSVNTATINGGFGNDTAYGGGFGGNATMHGSGGSSGHSPIGGGVNTLIGGAGSNNIFGSSSADVLLPGPPGSSNFIFAASPVQGINWDPTAGVLTFQGTIWNDTATVGLVTVGGQLFAQIGFTAKDSLGTNMITPQSQQILLSSLNYIYFYGQTGVNETFTNATKVPCNAYGGTGNNYFQGGGGNDYLYGGGVGSNNSLHGGVGDNVVVGGAGNNLLYGGGPGINRIVAGPGPGQNLLLVDVFPAPSDGTTVTDSVPVLAFN